jgi:hypothetical protein
MCYVLDPTPQTPCSLAGQVKDRELFVQTVTQHGGQARRRKQKHLQEIEILSIMKLVSS